MPLPLPVVNQAAATFECIFGRGCDGICCQNGRPSVGPEEVARIQGQLARALPLMRPEARELVEASGFTSNRKKVGQPMLRVVGGWCVFHNGGCVLHKLGMADGESYRYKPTQCALFPLDKDDDGTWYVRQWDYLGEVWDLFCLNPKQSPVPAVESLKMEIELAAKLEAGK
jgi:hypothetical protein